MPNSEDIGLKANRMIYKYVLPELINEPFIFPLPEGADILSVDFQGRELCLWANVHPNNPTSSARMVVMFTGFVVPEPECGEQWHHLATLQNGAYVFHVFYERSIKQGLRC